MINGTFSQIRYERDSADFNQLEKIILFLIIECLNHNDDVNQNYKNGTLCRYLIQLFTQFLVNQLGFSKIYKPGS